MASHPLRRRDVLRLLAGALSSALVLPLLAACGDDDDDDDDDDEGDGADATVSVTLGEWFVQAEPASVPPGSIEFVASNEGSEEHELVIIRTDLAADQLPVEENKVDEDAAGDEIGEIEEFPAGESESATFDLEAGHYALICNIEGHYESGMFLDFEVT